MPQPPADRDLEAGAALQTLVAAQAAVRARYAAQAAALARTSAQGFTGWYDTDRITDWATRLASRIEALQRATATNTDAYLARVFTQLIGKRVRPIGPVDVSTLRAGITHAGSYGRAADVYRWQQAQLDQYARDLATVADPIPPQLNDPITAAIERVAAVAEMDVQLADRAQSQQVLTEHADTHDARGYRRVVHPELSKGGTCGLCIAASDRVYNVADLRAVHAHCECTVLPIIGQLDPGSGLNNLDLGTLYENAGSTAGKALKRTRYQVDEHGELGAVLAPRGAKTRAPKQVQRDTNRNRPAKTDAEKAAQLRKVRDSLDPALARTRELAADDGTTWGTYLDQLEARIRDLDHQLAA